MGWAGRAGRCPAGPPGHPPRGPGSSLFAGCVRSFPPDLPRSRQPRWPPVGLTRRPAVLAFCACRCAGKAGSVPGTAASRMRPAARPRAAPGSFPGGSPGSSLGGSGCCPGLVMGRAARLPRAAMLGWSTARPAGPPGVPPLARRAVPLPARCHGAIGLAPPGGGVGCRPTPARLLGWGGCLWSARVGAPRNWCGAGDEAMIRTGVGAGRRQLHRLPLRHLALRRLADRHGQDRQPRLHGREQGKRSLRRCSPNPEPAYQIWPDRRLPESERRFPEPQAEVSRSGAPSMEPAQGSPATRSHPRPKINSA